MVKQGQIEQAGATQHLCKIHFLSNKLSASYRNILLGFSASTAFLLHIRKIFKEFADQQVNNMQM